MVFPSQFTIAPRKTEAFMAERAHGKQVKPTYQLKTLLLPGATRKILIMVKAGALLMQ